MRRHKREREGEERKAMVAFGLFSVLCLAGVFTLFSQVSLEQRTAHGTPGDGWTSFNPGSGQTQWLEDVLPASVESGLALPETTTADEKHSKEKSEDESPQKVLRLR